MASSSTKMTKAKNILTTLGSVAATVVLVRSLVKDLVPDEIQDTLTSTFRSFFGKFSTEFKLIIEEYAGLESNHLFEAAEVYLASRISPTTQRLKVSKGDDDTALHLAVDRDEEITDVFNDEVFKWTLVCTMIKSDDNVSKDMNTRVRSEIRAFHLEFHKRNREMATDEYLPHVMNMAAKMRGEKKAIKLYTSSDRYHDSWTGVNLNHPATFEKLAMDPELKKAVKDDLDRFVRRKDYYRRVGKAWKRGYLLYGPPGTGKSSLIAAMANYLKFDIYDLELTEVRSNLDLRRYLLETANRSILVVEDIDCSVEFADRNSDESDSPKSRKEHQMTLSGLLNFIDGLWSSCGDERIIVFTTNHKEKLDPALLRPGRMDMHIHMSYCTPPGFRVLASNYLKIKEHPLFAEIEELIRKVQVTPAEVAEQLLQHEEAESALEKFIVFMETKREENEEAEAKKLLEDAEARKLLEVADAKKQLEESKKLGEKKAEDNNQCTSTK